MDALHLIKYLLYGAIVLPTVFGNGLILIAIYRFRNLRSNMHILIANVAVSDLLVGAILLPADMLFGMLWLNRYKYICLCGLSMFVLSLGASSYNLTLISVERYLAIVYPLKVTRMRKSVMVLVISGGWVLSVCSASPPIVGWNNYTNETMQCYDQNIWTEAYMVWINGQFVSFIILNFILYSIVMRIAVQKSRNNSIFHGNVTVHNKRRKDLHQMVTMVIVLGAFALCWLPYVVMYFVVQVWNSPRTDYVRRVCLIPGLMNSGLNWIIYGYRNKAFRKAFQIIVKGIICRK